MVTRKTGRDDLEGGVNSVATSSLYVLLRESLFSWRET